MLAASIDHSAGVMVLTVAVGVPNTQAPSEREDEGEKMGRSPLAYAVTCALDTSPMNSGSSALVNPRVHTTAKQ